MAHATVGCRSVGQLKSVSSGSDQKFMSGTNRLPVNAGPIPDKFTI